MRLSRWSVILGLLFGVGIMFRIERWDFYRARKCYDCFDIFGVPFSWYYWEGGLFGIGHILWFGVLGNLVIGLMAGLTLALGLEMLWRKIIPSPH